MIAAIFAGPNIGRVIQHKEADPSYMTCSITREMALGSNAVAIIGLGFIGKPHLFYLLLPAQSLNGARNVKEVTVLNGEQLF